MKRWRLGRLGFKVLDVGEMEEAFEDVMIFVSQCKKLSRIIKSDNYGQNVETMKIRRSPTNNNVKLTACISCSIFKF